MGRRPIRDIIPFLSLLTGYQMWLDDDFAATPFFHCLLVGEQTRRGGQDCDAEATNLGAGRLVDFA